MVATSTFMRLFRTRFIAAGLLLLCAAPLVRADPGTEALPAHVARATDGKLYPAAGYRWASDAPHDYSVNWAPGAASPTYANVVAAATEGQWTPAAGYKWANDVPGDMTVVSTVDAQAVLRAAVKIGLSQGVLQEARKNDDGSLGAALGIQLLVATRDAAVLSAMNDLFPAASDIDCSAARRLLCLCMDGKLTSNNWKSAEAHDALLRRLRESNPDMANAAEFADFIGQVVDHQQQQ